ncbi:bifunctional hydroxymethylpyrimidine kinase/phosphomethylpyrimidine kinase [Thiocystis violacea]|uniref:bifunctional hydroxymethylpyrimidine kinase/phosphomethylpyrimidine kinase n=1 Tax=Thiocystis violacea TaxID=13725 RepID=UPI001907E11C|nr:hydroxymethylpyrimidine/phosphomethylpyrimidine kinase [Thiocystis violacea]MBK1722389.1 hydroxymethylpyrimidine/phosphomethylpyrimidine kinase [Thiocystis violacea]
MEPNDVRPKSRAEQEGIALKERPVVLCAGGHDPTGGAGILADAEAVQAAAAFAVTLITALTEQDTCGLRNMYPQPPEQVESQCRRLIADSAPRALKIGLLGSSGIVRILSRIIDEHTKLPVVLDPVLATGTGQNLVDAALLNQLRQHLLHRCTLITPNLPEARTLTDARSPDECAARLLGAGVRWALITGTHDDTEQVTNRLYGANGVQRTWDWPRLPHAYHGSGCTLASAIAARLAWGMEMQEAVASAQEYTWQALKHAFRTGHCQLTPNRLYHLIPRDHST